MNQKRMVLLSVAIVSAAGILAFQNCSVRRLSGGATGLTSIGGAAASGGTGTAGGGGGGGTTAAKACMMQPDDVGTIMGITAIPVIQTSYAMTLRSANTTLMLTNSSECLEKPPAVAVKCATPGPSPATPPACVSKSSLSVSLMLTCDASTTATTCTNFASKLNMDLAFDDAMLGSKITLTATFIPDVCNPAGATSYFMPFSGAKTGTMKIMSLSDLNDGTVAKVKITGAKLFKNGTDMTNAITIDALASSEIITFKACTP